jgi:hypothetical protein
MEVYMEIMDVFQKWESEYQKPSAVYLDVQRFYKLQEYLLDNFDVDGVPTFDFTEMHKTIIAGVPFHIVLAPDHFQVF